MRDHTGKDASSKAQWSPSRREVIVGGGGVLAAGGALAYVAHLSRNENGLQAEVMIQKAIQYDPTLVSLVASGLRQIGVTREEVKGKRILLKPNLVETHVGRGHINTNPTLVVAAAEAFRKLDARAVLVAEGQGHRRDSWLVLDESGMGRALDEAGIPFVDLNHDDVRSVPNTGGWTRLKELYLPRTLLEADWVVSMPKLKTHHWAGVTCSMKNLFGVMPGIIYGWPKNVLHHQGIHESILDIHATVRPALSIVDGIVGMEGDGPIMGTPKQTNCVLMGRNLPAVDATAVRVMGLNVDGVHYLSKASGKLGPIYERNIAQHGEPIESVRTRFEVLDYPHLHAVAQA